jgi:hypothetical protein
MKFPSFLGCFTFLVLLSFSFDQLLKVRATQGWDTDSSCTSLNYDCLASSNRLFGIIQTWSGGLGYNNDIKTCTDAAWSAGMNHVDVYLYICNNCYGNSDPSSVVSQVYNNLKNQGVQYGMFWFDIEQCGSGCWCKYSLTSTFRCSF